MKDKKMPGDPPTHVLVARTDKVGDLLLSLPVFQALKEAWPGVRTTALVSAGAARVVQGHPDVDAVEILDPKAGIPALAGRFRELAPDVFLALYPRARQALAARLARIPVRVGTAFRWYSFAFTDKVRVHRSSCDRHEVEYNLDLVRALGPEARAGKIHFPVGEEDRAYAKDLLADKGIGPKDPLVVVHPGHRGSALNWKPRRYGDLLEILCRKPGWKVALTGTHEEMRLITEVTALLGVLGDHERPAYLVGECDLGQLAAVLERAACLVSGSTGVMHLAAAVGTPTVSLFCPIPATTPVRWGPWGNESTVLMPEGLECPRCRVGKCSRHDPMDAIVPGDVTEAVERYVEKRKQ